MVRKTGFDPVASCTPSTRSAWLSYVLMKKCFEGGDQRESNPHPRHHKAVS